MGATSSDEWYRENFMEKYNDKNDMKIEITPESDCAVVIRCKNCKYRWHDGYCRINKRYTCDDAFCSEGVRYE